MSKANRRAGRKYRYRFMWVRVLLRRYRQKLAQGRILDGTKAFKFIASAGKALMEQHVNYDQVVPYPLERVWNPDVPPSFYVTRMHLSKDRSSLIVNSSLTLVGIPSIAHEYILGNKSALEWVISEYRVSIDKSSGIISNPNRDDDPEFIVRRFCQVVTVAVETQRLINELSRRVHWEDFQWGGVNESGIEEDLSMFWQR